MPYVGIGASISADNNYDLVFNSGMKVHAGIVPQVGVRVFKRLDVFAYYHISNKHYSRFMVNVGYIF